MKAELVVEIAGNLAPYKDKPFVVAKVWSKVGKRASVYNAVNLLTKYRCLKKHEKIENQGMTSVVEFTEKGKAVVELSLFYIKVGRRYKREKWSRFEVPNGRSLVAVDDWPASPKGTIVKGRSECLIR